MILLKIVFGIVALLLAWALLFRAHLIYTFNRWMREYAFSDQWVLFSRRRVAVLFLVLGGLALFSGVDHVMDQKRVLPATAEEILVQARTEFEQKRYVRAINRCKILLQLQPNNLEARELVAASWIASGNREKGEKEVALLYKIHPQYDIKKGLLKTFDVSKKDQSKLKAEVK